MAILLYKYLDVSGAVSMIQNMELQFTNPCAFNDPFDCHPGLFNTANPPQKPHDWPPQDFQQRKAESDLKNLREDTWVSCLSKSCDNLLLWSYYTKHQGVCIALDQELLDESLSGDLGFIGNAIRFEVGYKDVIEEKPDYFKSEQDALHYLLSIKGKVWEHEQEVRYCIYKPHFWLNWRTNQKANNDIEIKFYPNIKPSCFKRIYLGCRSSDEDKKKVLDAISKLSCEVEIYQMEIDANQFRVIPKRIM